MRATCDTNILARAAVRPAGPARAVLTELVSEQHVLVLSEHIVSELARVLRYERVRIQAELTDAEIDSFVNDVRELAELVAVPDPVPRATSDPDDDIVVATAVDGGAEVICTRDRHIRHRRLIAPLSGFVCSPMSSCCKNSDACSRMNDARSDRQIPVGRLRLSTHWIMHFC